MLTVLLWMCIEGKCNWVNESLSQESAVIAMCESGDTKNIGSVDWHAVNINRDGTIDQGAWQFNSYWVWNTKDRWLINPIAKKIGLTGNQFFKMYPTPNDAPPLVQYEVFNYMWDNGFGWEHWASSKSCWGKWMKITPHGQAILREDG